MSTALPALLRPAEPDTADPMRGERALWRAVVEHALLGIVAPVTEMALCYNVPGNPERYAPLWRRKELEYVMSERFVRHCVWAGLNPERIRDWLRHRGYLEGNGCGN